METEGAMNEEESGAAPEAASPWWPGVAVGLAVLLAALTGIVFAEHRQAQAFGLIEAAGGPIHRILDAADGATAEDGLVWVQGLPRVDRPARDREFEVDAFTPRLVRVVEMQQWRELDDGRGNVTYVRNWYDQPIESARFRRPENHENPPFPFLGTRFSGGTVALEGMLLDPVIVRALPGEEPVTPNFATLPANLAATFRLSEGKLWTNITKGSPRIGDLRVSWKQQVLQPISLVARVRSRVLVPSAALPAPGFIAMVGEVPPEMMVPGYPRVPRHGWLWRLLALLGVLGGTWLGLLAFRRRLPEPFAATAAAILPLALLGGAMWIGVGWRQLLAWWVLAGLAGGVLFWRRRIAWGSSE